MGGHLARPGAGGESPAPRAGSDLYASCVIFLSRYIFLVDDLLETLAEPNRRRILDLLADGERPAGDFSAALGLSQPGASRHLRVLREVGLVSVRAEGQRRMYRLEPSRLAELDAWLGRLLDSRSPGADP